MDEILPQIWVGDVNDALELLNNRKWALICVLEERPNVFEPELKEFKVFLPVLSCDKDSEMRAFSKNLDKIADTIDEALKEHENVLVFCGAGMERSPLALTWYIHKRKGVPLEDAFKVVQAKRKVACDRLYWIKKGGVTL